MLIRDPRDQAISMINYVNSQPGRKRIWSQLSSLSFADALSKWISDTSTIYSPFDEGWKVSELLQLRGIDHFYKHFLGWADEPNFIVIRFEDIIGPRGGGDLQVQLSEINKVAEHCGVKLTQQKVLDIANQSWGDTNTFTNVKDKVGQWKTHFTSEHKELFKRVGGQLLIDLGYEKDFDW